MWRTLLFQNNTAKHMKTQSIYEKPLTEEICLSAPVVLQAGSNTNYNEVYTIYYGSWEGEDEE